MQGRHQDSGPQLQEAGAGIQMSVCGRQRGGDRRMRDAPSSPQASGASWRNYGGHSPTSYTSGNPSLASRGGGQDAGGACRPLPAALCWHVEELQVGCRLLPPSSTASRCPSEVSASVQGPLHLPDQGTEAQAGEGTTLRLKAVSGLESAPPMAEGGPRCSESAPLCSPAGVAEARPPRPAQNSTAVSFPEAMKSGELEPRRN